MQHRQSGGKPHYGFNICLRLVEKVLRLRNAIPGDFFSPHHSSSAGRTSIIDVRRAMFSVTPWL